ncbi:poly(A) polymerase pla1 [Purpureocillium lilacinum]|uniref:polynucleotide adenylyltransferase n=1 Tax=Purpureocillium lilacinum TaxID=33203 RepID=A0A179HVH5_PURLI|nr:poly(A) polymerase pla1 [Purpureocillium lilacinum]OAQ94506.1 poly(A) polymerase pla1 [Purpureocillium lilacinum]
MATACDHDAPTTRPPLELPSSFDTALCLVPPSHLWPRLDRIRSLYDPAHAKWPPHVNLLYPFVPPELLPDVARLLSEAHLERVSINLSVADAFVHRKHNSVILRPAEPDAVSCLRSQACSALGWPPSHVYRPHMTVGQTTDVQSDAHRFLLEKAQLLAPVTWDVAWLAIMVRDPSSRRMMPWAQLHLNPRRLQRPAQVVDFPVPIPDTGVHGSSAAAQSQTTYHFQSPERGWEPLPVAAHTATDETQSLVVASYNVLAEFQWPPNPSRYPGLITNILSARAAADILILQEVTDHFLPSLLNNSQICARYPFSTHGPALFGPLPSLLNVVVLSRLPFRWEYLPFQRKHKGAAVLCFPTLGSHAQNGAHPPLVFAACHLTQGLVDGAVVAKRNELQKLSRYLSDHYHAHPLIVAGDFNIATSSYSIDSARQKQDLSSHGLQCLADIQSLFNQVGLEDAWLLTRVGIGESSSTSRHLMPPQNLHEGEEGATFNPLTNQLAARSVGSGTNNRPQRYDRILVSSSLALRPCGFNMFGDVCPEASDHWGIRCLLQRPVTERPPAEATSARHVPMRLVRAPVTLGGANEIKDALSSHGCLPGHAEEALRQQALALLEGILLAKDAQESGEGSQPRTTLVLVPVGSFGLGVWTTSSDMDCLCIGSMSPKVFFAVASQRLKKAASQGVQVLRRVKANTGTMLEVDVRGIKFDLQYCAAGALAQNYPDILKRPASDPAFVLPVQTLAKLKPARDLYYLRRSIPDMAQYRLAHLLVKEWAKSRGLYAAKLGLLGGIHITAMLVPICKLLTAAHNPLSTADILISFFYHYANFDWESNLVFDTHFHKDLRYRRAAREPLYLDRKVPALRARIWPERFADKASSTSAATERDGCYLIGLEWRDSGAADKSKEESRDARRLLETALRGFEARMQGDDKYYDKSCCWLLVSEAHGKDVRSLQLESAGFSPDECGDTDSEGDSDTDADDEADNCMDGQYGGAPAGNASEVKMPDPQQSVSKPNSRGKLRSASDVMHRLRWDAAIDAGDYMVGYEDRFTGAREKPLVQWKSEQTDEEFIPQHRILYFRCRSTGDIVWERRTRTDHVFGSGTSLHEGT